MNRNSPKLGASLALAACLAGCGVHSLPTAEAIVERLPEYEGDMERLRRGRAMVVTSCTGCHRFFFPDEYRPGAWRRLADDMGRRMFMGRKTTAVMRKYLTAASAHSLEPPAGG